MPEHLRNNKVLTACIALFVEYPAFKLNTGSRLEVGQCMQRINVVKPIARSRVITTFVNKAGKTSNGSAEGGLEVIPKDLALLIVAGSRDAIFVGNTEMLGHPPLGNIKHPLDSLMHIPTTEHGQLEVNRFIEFIYIRKLLELEISTNLNPGSIDPFT